VLPLSDFSKHNGFIRWDLQVAKFKQLFSVANANIYVFLNTLLAYSVFASYLMGR